MTRQSHLHFIEPDGAVVSDEIRDALRLAFGWVMREFPNLDEANLADWAESLGQSMAARGNGISSPKQFAYPALRGKVLDSFRKRSAQERSSGLGRDLERIDRHSGSFQEPIERKILFDQLQEALSQRDRDILLMLLNDRSTQDVADQLKTSSPAARKAIQRVKERIGALLSRKPDSKDGRTDSFVNRRGLAIER